MENGRPTSESHWFLPYELRRESLDPKMWYRKKNNEGDCSNSF